jgi:hypothetical protein
MKQITITPVTTPKTYSLIEFETVSPKYYYFAVSSDTLLIVDYPTTRIIESIIRGVDDNAFVCVCEELNEFLDYISLIKKCIERGDNPIIVFNIRL